MIKPDWFAARGMPAQQIAQSIADNYQIEEPAYDSCQLIWGGYCWATVADEGEQVYVTDENRSLVAGTLITVLSEGKPSFN